VTRRVRPLAARNWLLRNPRRVGPVIVVQALVTALVLAVVTPLTGFEATVEANLNALRVYTALTPMRRSEFDPSLTRIIDANPHMERHVRAKALWMRTPMIVGESYTMLIALDGKEQEEFLRRVGDRLVEGALPKAGTGGAAIHRDVARARGMKVGDKFGRLVDPEDPAPGAFEVVGIVDGPSRVGVSDLGYAMLPAFVLSRLEAFEVVYAKPGEKAESDRYLNEATDPEGGRAFKVWDEAFARRRTEKQLENLPMILNAVVGAITVVIALVVALLSLISFQSRADEFALLLAVGHTRGRLARKVAVESAVTAAVAWALGLALGFGFLFVWNRVALEPKAILIRFFDPYPIVLASALPFVAAAVSAGLLTLRLHRMDPVSVIQRRNA
jgi:hypothetical protein